MSHTTPPVTFEPEFIKVLTKFFEQRITFNQVLGLKITSLTPERVAARIAMRPELIGSAVHQRIHGGVIASGLDSMGGLAIMAALGARHMDEAPLHRMRHFARLATIDLRVDYLRPGTGTDSAFDLRAEVLRLGSRVASTRMEFLGEDGQLLSTGTAAYIVS
ncbi:MAG: thioesterase family protein [Acidovorax sp.]